MFVITVLKKQNRYDRSR